MTTDESNTAEWEDEQTLSRKELALSLVLYPRLAV